MQQARPGTDALVEQLMLLDDSLYRFTEVHKGSLSDPTAVRAWRDVYNMAFAKMLRIETARRETI